MWPTSCSIKEDGDGNRQRTLGILREPAQYILQQLKKGSVERRVPSMEVFVLLVKSDVGRMVVDCERQIFNGSVYILSIIARGLERGEYHLETTAEHRATGKVLGYKIREVQADIRALTETPKCRLHLPHEAGCVLVLRREALERVACCQHRRVHFIPGVHIGDAEKLKGALPGVFVRRCD